jgi:hypothetical protein
MFTAWCTPQAQLLATLLNPTENNYYFCLNIN